MQSCAMLGWRGQKIVQERRKKTINHNKGKRERVKGKG